MPLVVICKSRTGKSGLMTVRAGWRRLPGHFLIWAGAPHVVSYVALTAGLHDPAILVNLAEWLLPVFALWFLAGECRGVLNEKQTPAKALLDFMSKCLGLYVGFATWTRWW